MRKEEMENYYTIDINGEAMPLACTLRVLEEITKKYGSIEEFCLKVYKPKMDDESKKLSQWQCLILMQSIQFCR